MADRGCIVNPHNKTHGAPADEERHVGDLGNYKTDAQGNAQGSVQDKLIKLIGSESVIGVGYVVSEGEAVTNAKCSALSSSTPALTISERVAMRSPRRLAMLALVPPAVCFSILLLVGLAIGILMCFSQASSASPLKQLKLVQRVPSGLTHRMVDQGLRSHDFVGECSLADR